MGLLQNLLEKTPEFWNGCDSIFKSEKEKFDSEVEQNKFALITLNEKFYIEVN